MNEQSFAALEYDKLRFLVKKYAQTPMGATLIENLSPISERDELQRNLNAVGERAELSARNVNFTFQNLAEPSQSLAVLRIQNATLDPLSMLDLANLVQQTLSARLILQSEQANVPTLWQIVEKVPRELQRTSRRIQEKILSGGVLDDNASPELFRLRRDIKRQRERIAKSLESLMKNTDSAVQDEYITVRNDRFVIPIKADFRGRLQGVAHGFSSSGQTIFIEPLQTIDANNELQALREAEEREIAKILFDLTESLRWDLDGLELCAEVATELDFVNAKARFLREFDAIVPTISDDDTLELVDARHPLLQQTLREATRKIVPLTFDLTDGKPVIIISGANAGGKTVVLKTAGLLSLMALSGLPIPARRAQVPFYQSILADIGDQQSIAANLSTFTSHISNISKMMEICETPSLVLLDEVGTGTDPEEGSALGVAVVDYFRNSCHAQVIASTHYRGLKMYAANNDFVQNASVEFNEKTLQPTYKLLVGIAGASSGLSIAQRFGIPAHVIEKAKENVDSSSLEAENYLHNLRREVTNANEVRNALEDERQVVAESFAKAELDFKRREAERQREFEKEIVKTIEDFERQTKVIVENIEDKVTKSRLEKEAAARRSELKRLATESVQSSKFKVQNSNNESDAAQKAEDQTLSIGKKVRLKNFGSIGTIEKLNGDEAEILVGVMRLREKIVNIEVVATEQDKPTEGKLEKLQKQAKASESNIDFDEENQNAELNIIGKRTDEAEDLLDKFLDKSYLSGFQKVRIVHGIGTGALKNFVHSFLKNHAHVSRYTLAHQTEGGNGATIVELEK